MKISLSHCLVSDECSVGVGRRGGADVVFAQVRVLLPLKGGLLQRGVEVFLKVFVLPNRIDDSVKVKNKSFSFFIKASIIISIQLFCPTSPREVALGEST